VHDLREAVDGVVKPVVESVDKDKNFASSPLFCRVRNGGGEGSLVEIVGGRRHEIALRISRQRCRVLNLTRLAGTFRWNRYSHRGIGDIFSALAAEHVACICCRSPPSGGSEHRHA